MNAHAFSQWRQDVADPTRSFSPLIMGVLNVTPDSFYDGGRYDTVDKAYDRALQMLDEGADILDVGGESSRPGALALSLDEELSRLLPVIERIRAVSDVCISVDTYKAAVMSDAVAAGATMINDIRALQEEHALSTVARLGVPVCLMHMQGVPLSMQDKPTYPDDVIETLHLFFEQRIAACLAAGLAREQLLLDPGFGFGKTVQHNMIVMQNMDTFQRYHLPVLIGVSRKSSISVLLKNHSADRLFGSLALAAWAFTHGAAIVRTHDVHATRDVLLVCEALMQGVKDK